MRQIQKADEKIEENTTVFGKDLLRNLDTEIREEFTKQLERIIEAAKKSSKEKLWNLCELELNISIILHLQWFLNFVHSFVKSFSTFESVSNWLVNSKCW